MSEYIKTFYSDCKNISDGYSSLIFEQRLLLLHKVFGKEIGGFIEYLILICKYTSDLNRNIFSLMILLVILSFCCGTLIRHFFSIKSQGFFVAYDVESKKNYLSRNVLIFS